MSKKIVVNVVADVWEIDCPVCGLTIMDSYAGRQANCPHLVAWYNSEGFNSYSGEPEYFSQPIIEAVEKIKTDYAKAKVKTWTDVEEADESDIQNLKDECKEEVVDELIKLFPDLIEVVLETEGISCGGPSFTVVDRLLFKP